MNSQYLARVSLLIKIALGVFWLSFALISPVSAQSASEAYLRFYAPKDIVFEQERLPFTVELHNPTDESLGIVRVGVQFSTLIEIIDLDSRCGERIPSNQSQIICTLPNVEAQSFNKIEFAVVGNLDDRPGFSAGVFADPFSTSTTSLSGEIATRNQATDTVGLSDGSRFVEGQTLSIGVARHVLFDPDGDGLGYISEILAGTDPSDATSLPRRNAIIDATFLYSQQADSYTRGKIGPLVENLLTSTNQFFRDNEINITLRLAALGLQEYDKPDATLEELYNDFVATNSEGFPDLDAIRISTGADLLFFLHATGGNEAGDFCLLSTQADAIHGDFYPEAHAGRLLSVINFGPSCTGINDLAGTVAINMGIVSSRAAEPNGGTFPFSAGHVTPEGIATRETRFGRDHESNDNISSFVLNRFSDTQKMCGISACGFDRNDLANGADTVFSLNATRYLVAELTTSVLPIPDPEFFDRPTVGRDRIPQLNITLSSSSAGAIKGQLAPVAVELTNEGSEAVHDLRVRFGGDIDDIAFVTEDDQCFVRAEEWELVSESDYQIPTKGEVVCFVRKLEPNQKAGFNFQAEVLEEYSPGEAVALTLSGRVNTWFFPASGFCIPFFDNAADSQQLGNPCPSFVQSSSPINSEENTLSIESFDTSLRPQLEGDKLTVPYLRVFDGSLVSALFEVLSNDSSRLRLLDYQELDDSIQPERESTFSEDGELTLRGVSSNGKSFDISAMQVNDMNSGEFKVISVVEVD